MSILSNRITETENVKHTILVNVAIVWPRLCSFVKMNSSGEIIHPCEPLRSPAVPFPFEWMPRLSKMMSSNG